VPLRLVLAFPLFIALVASSAPPAALIAQPAGPTIAGAWVLNPALTQRPDEIGFSPEWARALGSGGEGGGPSGGGHGRRGGSGSGGAMGGPAISRVSADDSTRVQQLTADARTPPARLTIVRQDATIAIADDQGHARTFRPDGRLDDLTLGTVALPTTARWDGASLVVVYEVETGRQLRYTYTPLADPTRLQVNIRFLERGREGDEVRLTYEPPGAHERVMSSGASSPVAPSASASTSPVVPDAAAPSGRPPVLPPGSELRGLTTIGTVVEDLSAQGKACGLDQEKIKTSIARILADAGFKTERSGNEDTYVLLSVLTSRLPDGTCVSRYDASLVTQADATLPYLKGLVAVPVQLLHEGGMAGGSPASHASAVMDALVKSANHFVSQIRAAGVAQGVPSPGILPADWTADSQIPLYVVSEQ